MEAREVRKTVLGSIALALTFIVVPASAHHSFAMYDNGRIVTVSGTVKEFDWVNPHSWVRITVTAQDGKQELWAIELASVGQQARIGWKPDTLKPGDKVTAQIRPMKDGTRGGMLVSITLPDGKTLGHGGMPNSDFGTIE